AKRSAKTFHDGPAVDLPRSHPNKGRSDKNSERPIIYLPLRLAHRASSNGWEVTMSKRLAAGLLLLAVVGLTGTAVAQQAAGPLTEAVRTATEKYKDPAAAIADGYAAMPCVSGPASGAMGIHFVNVKYLEDG